LEKRAEGLNKIDAKLRHRVSQQNQSVQAIYDKYLEYPMSRKAKELVHTKYFPKFRK
jgi:NADP-reducing hydrogenase subunit HndD